MIVTTQQQITAVYNAARRDIHREIVSRNRRICQLATEPRHHERSASLLEIRHQAARLKLALEVDRSLLEFNPLPTRLVGV